MTSKKRLRTDDNSLGTPAKVRKAKENLRQRIHLLTPTRTDFVQIDKNRLELRYQLDLSISHFQHAFAVNPNVQHLDLSGCFSFDTSLKECLRFVALNWGHSLTSLCLQYCSLTDCDLVEFSQLLRPSNLQKINVSFTSLSDVGLRALAQSSPKLNHLNVQSCPLITDYGMSAVARFCKQISVINASECKFITDYSIQILSQESKLNLLDLNLNDCPQITGAIFGHLAFYSSKLQRLKIRQTKVPAQDLADFCTRVSLLELNVDSLPISDSHLEWIANTQSSMETLDLSFCHQITIDGLRDLVTKCTNLQEVHLYGKTVDFKSALLNREDSPTNLKVFL